MGFIINKDDRKSAELLDCGSFGLEKENLRLRRAIERLRQSSREVKDHV